MTDEEALRLARARFAPGGVLHEDIDALIMAEHDAKERAEKAEAEATKANSEIELLRKQVGLMTRAAERWEAEARGEGKP